MQGVLVDTCDCSSPIPRNEKMKRKDDNRSILHIDPTTLNKFLRVLHKAGFSIHDALLILRLKGKGLKPLRALRNKTRKIPVSPSTFDVPEIHSCEEFASYSDVLGEKYPLQFLSGGINRTSPHSKTGKGLLGLPLNAPTPKKKIGPRKKRPRKD